MWMFPQYVGRRLALNCCPKSICGKIAGGSREPRKE
jgi:hypothetical protein